MALKDLITDASKLDEDAIEKVISQFVRYDPKAGRIVFTPEGTTLSNEKMILVYLTAVSGWSFVSETPPQTETKPNNLESVLGIPGGTLRPTLKKLKDAHLLVNASGHYAIETANLSNIQALVLNEGIAGSPPLKTKSRSTKRTKSTEKCGETGKKSKSKRGGGSASEALDNLVSQDFFKGPRTLRELKEKLEELGLIFPQSALSGLVLNAVRANVLKREKIESNGRTVWAYSNHV